MRFVDSHLHLSSYPNTGGVLNAARLTGARLLACSVDLESSRETVSLSRENAGLVSAFVGLHPSEADKATGLGWIRELLARASGVGEVGLDPKYPGFGAGGGQERAFEEQLSAAEEARKPVQVHARGAEADCLERLGSYSLTAVLLHWFDGENELESAEQKGYYVSFGPALLTSKRIQRIASRYSQDLVLAESDGPITFSALGGANGLVTIPSVLFKLAELKRTGFEEMAESIAKNSAAYLPPTRPESSS